MSASLNRSRAGWARMALTTFGHQVGEDDDQTLILDLIADLGRLAQRRRLDFVRIVAQAVSTWACERKCPEGMEPRPQVCIAIAGRPPAYARTERELVPPAESPRKASTPRPVSGRLALRARSGRPATRKDKK